MRFIFFAAFNILSHSTTLWRDNFVTTQVLVQTSAGQLWHVFKPNVVRPKCDGHKVDSSVTKSLVSHKVAYRYVIDNLISVDAILYYRAGLNFFSLGAKTRTLVKWSENDKFFLSSSKLGFKMRLTGGWRVERMVRMLRIARVRQRRSKTQLRFRRVHDFDEPSPSARQMRLQISLQTTNTILEGRNNNY